MSECIEGLWAAMATPLDATGGIDHALFARHAAWLLSEGCHGLVPYGTTGEGTSFSIAERLAATEALLAAGIRAGQLCLGAGFPALSDTVEMTKRTLALGIRHVLLLPPYFYRDVDADGLHDAFAAIIDAVADPNLRVTLYNIPQVSGVAVPPETVARLRERYGPVIAGVKDSSAMFPSFQAYRAASPGVAIVVGNEPDIFRAMAEGGAGTICGMVNLAPALVRAMFNSPEAAAPMREAVGSLSGGHFLPIMKSILAAQTGNPAWLRCRPPLRAAEPALGRRRADILAALPTPKAA